MTEVPSTPDPVDGLLAPEQPVVDSAPAPVTEEPVVTPNADGTSEDAPLEPPTDADAEEVPPAEEPPTEEDSDEASGLHIAYI